MNELDAREKVKLAFQNVNKLHNENKDTFPRNILLVGQPAAGKSSLVNLFRATCKGEYSGVAIAGSPGIGEDDSVTEHLLFYPSMGLNANEVQEFKETFQFASDFCLPTLIDMPGIRRNDPDIDQTDPERIHEIHKRNIENVFKYVIDGIVADETQISSALSGKQRIKKRDYSQESQERLKIDRVVFVISLTQDIDEELLKIVMSIISSSHGERKVIPYVAIFTHTDCVGDGEDCVTEETAERRRKTAAGILKIGDNMKLNSHDVVNYNDKDEADEIEDYRYKTNYEKHFNAIRAFCKLCTRRRIIDDQPSVKRGDVLKEKVGDCMHQLRRAGWMAFRIIRYITLVVVIAYLCHQIIMNPKETKQILQWIWNITNTAMNSVLLI